MQNLELSDMLVMLRQELKSAQQKAEEANEDLRFNVEDIEVEVNFTIAEETATKAGAEAKFKFWVFSEAKAGVEVNDKFASQKVHKIKLKLTPENADGGDVKINSGKAPRPK